MLKINKGKMIRTYYGCWQLKWLTESQFGIKICSGWNQQGEEEMEIGNNKENEI